MKQSIVIKEVNGEEVERVIRNSMKLAHKYYVDQKFKLTDEEKQITKFRIVQKNK